MPRIVSSGILYNLSVVVLCEAGKNEIEEADIAGAIRASSGRGAFTL